LYRNGVRPRQKDFHRAGPIIRARGHTEFADRRIAARDGGNYDSSGSKKISTRGPNQGLSFSSSSTWQWAWRIHFVRVPFTVSCSWKMVQKLPGGSSPGRVKPGLQKSPAQLLPQGCGSGRNVPGQNWPRAKSLGWGFHEIVWVRNFDPRPAWCLSHLAQISSKMNLRLA